MPINRIITFSTFAVAAPGFSKDTEKYKSNDMVHVFGWMEDACDGEKNPYKTIYEKISAFTDSIRGMTADYENVVKPRSQWLPEYWSTIKNVKMSVGDQFTKYKVIFKDGVKYRGQSLAQYEFKFIPESSGGEDVLKFSPKANVATILSKFETREVEYWDEMVDRGATYNFKLRCFRFPLLEV